MTEDKPKRSLLTRLRTRYVFLVRNEENFEVRFSIRTSFGSLIMITGGLSVVLIALVAYLIAFTPLREYIPGYADVSTRKDILYLSMKTDSLETVLQERSDYIRNIRRILNDSVADDSSAQIRPDTMAAKHPQPFAPPSHADSLLRAKVEAENPYNVALGGSGDNANNNLNDLFFFAPLKGIITNGFNPAANHYGVDISAKENEAVKATLDGTIILSTWTLATGNVIIIQHKDNVISVYEHNSVLMKKIGDNVQAGDVIAIVGNSGELTSGTHLHFELWSQGNPVNPIDYISF